ncbi:MAG: NAD(+)/NADH kinase [Candidatus Melainabacteria bacterium]|nr:NAD(+)/NADH kinase [Candidatus Melainabacteria bacterium]
MKKHRPGRTLRRVLIIHKDSTYQTEALEKKDPRFLKLIQEGSEVVRTVSRTHEQHVRTMEQVEAALAARGIAYGVVNRQHSSAVGEDVDLIITVGGDGTFLHSARECTNIPILGVNSATSTSLGHFCLANGDTFGDVLDGIVSGKRRWHRLARLQLVLNGEALPVPVLNEILVHDAHPAGPCTNFIELDGVSEKQMSSGIYVATAAGSTGANRSAGGRILPITQRQFLYLVREPGMRPGDDWQLLGGAIAPHAQIKITSRMSEGKIFADGKYGFVYDFLRGDELIVRLHPQDLRAYIDPTVNSRYGTIK